MIFCFKCDRTIKPCDCGIWWCTGFKHVRNRADGGGSHFCYLGDKDHIAEPGDSLMANILDALCTCPEYWRGQRERPKCKSHPERESTESE